MKKPFKSIVSAILCASILCSSLLLLNCYAFSRTISFSDIVSESVSHNGVSIKTEKYDYQIVFGKPGISEYTANNFTDQWGQKAVCYIPDGESSVKAYMATGLKSTNKELGAMLKITSKEMINVKFTHPNMNGIQGGSHINIRVYHMVNNMPQIISTVPLSSSAVEENFYTPKSVVLKPGESVYWSFETSNEWGLDTEIYPSVEISDATEVTEDSLSINDMIAGTVNNEGNSVNTEFAEYHLYTGKYNNPVNFNTFTKDFGSGSWNDNWQLRYYDNGNQKTAMEITNMDNNLKIGCMSISGNTNEVSDTIIKLKINKNCKLDITHPEIPTVDWRGSHTRVSIYLQREGMRNQILLDKPTSSSAIAENTLGMTDIRLQSGDQLFYIYHSTNEWGSSLQITPTFNFCNAEAPIAPNEESVNVNDFILGMSESNGQAVNGYLLSYQALTGTVDNEITFPVTTDTNLSCKWAKDTDSDTDKQKKNTYVSVDTIQASQDHDVLFKITARENIAVTLSHPALNLWLAGNGGFKIIGVSGKNKCVIKDTAISDSNRSADFYVASANSFSMSKGDIIYLDLYSVNDWNFYADLLPTITANKESYNVEQAISSVIQAKTDAINNLDAVYASLSQELYSTENWNTILGLIAQAKSNISKEMNSQSIISISTNAVNEIKSIQKIGIVDNQTINYSKMFEKVVAASGGQVDTPLISYSFLTGTTDNVLSFNNITSSELRYNWYSESDSATDKELKTTFFQENRMQASDGHENIIKIMANENICVDLSHPKLVSWLATNGKFKVIVKSSGKTGILKDIEISDSKRDKNSYFSGIEQLHLNKGDILYLSVYTTNEWYFYSDILPTLTISTTKYDSSKSVGNLFNARQLNKDSLNNYFNLLSSSNYSAENWEKISEMVTDTVDKFSYLNSIVEIENLRISVISQIKQVQSLSDMTYEILTIPEMIKGMKNSNGAEVSSAFATYQLLTGKIGNEKIMDHQAVPGDTCVDGSNEMYEVWTVPKGAKNCQDMPAISSNSLRAVNKYDSIIKLKILKNGKIRITHPKLSGWCPDYTKFKIVRVRNGNTQILSDKFISELSRVDNAYTPDIGAVKAGDIIYLVYYTTNEYYGGINLVPTIEIGNFPIEQTSEVISVNDVIKESVNGYNGKVCLKNCDIELDYGKVGAIAAFSQSDGQTVWEKGNSFNSASVGFASNGTVRASLSYDAIVKITAKNTAAFNFSIQQDSIPSNCTIRIYQSIDNNNYLITQSSTGFTSSISSNTGDIMYIVFSTTKSNALLKANTTLSIDLNGYDMYNRSNEIREETYTMKDMIGEVIDHGGNGGVMNRYLSTFALMNGTIKSETNYLSLSPLATQADALYDSTGNTSVNKNGIKAGMLGNDCIIKFTAKKDLKLSITHPEITYLWPGNTGIKMTVESEGLCIDVKNTKMAKVLKGKNYYLDDVQLKAGDSLYISYYSVDSYYGIIDLAPTFKFSTADYNASERPGFDELKHLQTTIKKRTDELKAYLATFNEDDYSTINWLSMKQIVDDAIENMAEATSVSQVDEIYESAKRNLDNVKTAKQQEEELATLKEEKVKELKDLVDSLNKNDYSSANWNTISSIYTSYSTIIKNAKNTANVLVAFDTAKKAILDVPKGMDAKARSTSNFKRIVIIGCIAVVVLGGVGTGLFVYYRKKKKN